MGGQRFYTEGFGCVVSGIQDVDAQLFRQSVSPVRSFAGYESIDPFIGSYLQVATSSAGHDADAPASLRPARDDEWFGPGCPLETVYQVNPRDACYCLETDLLAMSEEERAHLA